MKLVVVRYRNYGCTFSGDDEGEECQNKFYWSFFELNNGVVYVLHFIEFWKNKKQIDHDIEISYADSELLDGKIIKYDFEQEFFDWFEALPPVKDLKELTYPNKEAVECIKAFFYREIFNTRTTATDIIKV